jgi:hypothetical protein
MTKDSAPGQLKDLCLELLWAVFNSGKLMTHLVNAIDLEAFLTHNIIMASSNTAALACRILGAAVHQSSAEFKV